MDLLLIIAVSALLASAAVFVLVQLGRVEAPVLVIAAAFLFVAGGITLAVAASLHPTLR